MTIEQTIEIPAGKVILTFTPAIAGDGLGFEGECPLSYRFPFRLVLTFPSFLFASLPNSSHKAHKGTKEIANNKE